MNRERKLMAVCGYCSLRYPPAVQAGIVVAVCPMCKAGDSQEVMYDSEEG